jgi:hypothetical protein
MTMNPGPGMRQQIRAGKMTVKEAASALSGDPASSPGMKRWLDNHRDTDWEKRGKRLQAENESKKKAAKEEAKKKAAVTAASAPDA